MYNVSLLLHKLVENFNAYFIFDTCILLNKRF